MKILNNHNHTYHKAVLYLLSCCLLLFSCVEEFDVETEDFESILVVNATITNELKRQEVLLTRTFRFEENGPAAEQGAIVKIIEDETTTIPFDEIFPGRYESIIPFTVVPNKNYQLSIETVEGRVYLSKIVQLPPVTSNIERVFPMRMTNNDGVEGVGLFVDSFDETGNSKFYRYQFEETYKIVARFWVPVDLTPSLEFVERSENQQICFNNRVSEEILITDTNTLNEDRVSGFFLRFIQAEDIRVSERYSILVRQFVQSQEANGFYQTLSNFSQSESLFSQVQPGFISGNITSQTNPNERVLGFFNVASVKEERIFFDREEFLNDLPRFSPGCDRIIPRPNTGETPESFDRRLRELIRSGSIKFLEEIRGSEPGSGVLVFVPRPCGDCTVFGSSAVPDFWVD